MSAPKDLIFNGFLAEDARRAYAPGRLCFESSMSARVGRRVHASRGTFEYKNDLHACAESTRKGSKKPDGWIVNRADLQGVSLTDHAV